MNYDVIVIGAGASGLLAAFDLSNTGKKILILEAKDRIGGRIFTDHNTAFTVPVELGAEFVHGNLPLSLSLLKMAKIKYDAMEGRSYTVKKGKLLTDVEFGLDWEALMSRLGNLQTDMPISDFLQEHFSGDENFELRESVIRFAQGFDAADPAKVSALSLQKEWMNDNEDNQFRIKGGYVRLIQWLANKALNRKAELKLLHVVSAIDYTGENPLVTCKNGVQFSASTVLITIPLGVWQRHDLNGAMIEFIPALPVKQDAAETMGFGNVIKMTVEFAECFWETNGSNCMPGTGFIFSDAIIPTWWTQNPVKTPLLTGWIAGPPADAFNHLTEDEMNKVAVDSLSNIFNLDIAKLKEKIKAFRIINWGNDPFACGGYSYETLQSSKAKKKLQAPVESKLFFAGEALYEGAHNGTVEAAFESGRRAAKEISSLSA